jgi:RHS repeat-associated protein
MSEYYYFRDNIGSVREMLDASGSVVSEATYDPYGVATITGSVTPTFQYAGYYAHQGSGLSLTWYRGYDPVIGRWLSRDPLPDAERLQGMNLYQYVGNNPVNLNDPMGLKKCVGKARILGGNPKTVGGPSGFPPGRVQVGSAAADPTQWGGHSTLARNASQISGVITDSSGKQTGSFSGISDVIGGKSPIEGMGVRDALKQLNPGNLIVELVTGKDQGVQTITLTVPCNQPCPEGTAEQ